MEFGTGNSVPDPPGFVSYEANVDQPPTTVHTARFARKTARSHHHHRGHTGPDVNVDLVSVPPPPPPPPEEPAPAPSVSIPPAAANTRPTARTTTPEPRNQQKNILSPVLPSSNLSSTPVAKASLSPFSPHQHHNLPRFLLSNLHPILPLGPKHPSEREQGEFSSTSRRCTITQQPSMKNSIFKRMMLLLSPLNDGWWSGELLDEERREEGRHIFPSNFVVCFRCSMRPVACFVCTFFFCKYLVSIEHVFLYLSTRLFVLYMWYDGMLPGSIDSQFDATITE